MRLALVPPASLTQKKATAKKKEFNSTETAVHRGFGEMAEVDFRDEI